MQNIRFDSFALGEPLQRALTEKGYTIPSPIQAQAIPVLLDGHDMMGCAQTGTGKTAAFALPILHHLFAEDSRLRRGEIRALVLTPTRELAMQVAESFRSYGKHLRPHIGLVYGGVSQHPQTRALREGLDVLVATPGRLLDLWEQGHVNLSRIRHFVLDEADRMLDMGFIGDIQKIAAELPRERQTLLFSATMAGQVAKLAATLLRNPKEIRITPDVTTAEKIEQRVLFVQSGNKTKLLLDLLQDHCNGEKTKGLGLVFSRTKHGASKLATQLNRAGIRADSIHGDKSQSARQHTLARFRNGHTPVLVATDVAARGIDVREITLVINYDLPMEADNYVHRIGRTARAGAEGRALSFCSGDDLALLRAVEKQIRQPILVEAEHEHHDAGLAEQHRTRKSTRQGFVPRHARGGRGGYQGRKEGSYRTAGGRFQGKSAGNQGRGKFRASAKSS